MKRIVCYEPQNGFNFNLFPRDRLIDVVSTYFNYSQRDYEYPVRYWFKRSFIAIAYKDGGYSDVEQFMDFQEYNKICDSYNYIKSIDLNDGSREQTYAFSTKTKAFSLVIPDNLDLNVLCKIGGWHTPVVVCYGSFYDDGIGQGVGLPLLSFCFTDLLKDKG